MILGNVQLISSGLPTEARELRGLTEEIRSAAEGGARLIRKLLTFSRKSALSGWGDRKRGDRNGRKEAPRPEKPATEESPAPEAAAEAQTTETAAESR